MPTFCFWNCEETTLFCTALYAASSQLRSGAAGFSIFCGILRTFGLSVETGSFMLMHAPAIRLTVKSSLDHSFSGSHRLTNVLLSQMSFFTRYFCSIFFAEFRAIVVCNPQLPHRNSLSVLSPSAPQAEQIFPVFFELISTSSTEWTLHL